MARVGVMWVEKGAVEMGGGGGWISWGSSRSRQEALGCGDVLETCSTGVRWTGAVGSANGGGPMIAASGCESGITLIGLARSGGMRSRLGPIWPSIALGSVASGDGGDGGDSGDGGDGDGDTGWLDAPAGWRGHTAGCWKARVMAWT